jgi:hypothetical protein
MIEAKAEIDDKNWIFKRIIKIYQGHSLMWSNSYQGR